MNASYSEEFKRNTVAVVKAGYAINPLAERLGMPSTTIRNWLHLARFIDIQPADEQLLAALPPVVEQEKETQPQRLLVPITKTAKDGESIGEVKIRIGKIEIEVGKNSDKDVLSTIIRVLGEAGVL